MLRCKVHRLSVIASLLTHGDCNIKVELQIPRRLDKLFEFVDVLQLRITIQQKRGMIRIGFMVFVEFFEVFDQKMYSLRVQKLARTLENA